MSFKDAMARSKALMDRGKASLDAAKARGVARQTARRIDATGPRESRDFRPADTYRQRGLSRESDIDLPTPAAKSFQQKRMAPAVSHERGMDYMAAKKPLARRSLGGRR